MGVVKRFSGSFLVVSGIIVLIVILIGISDFSSSSFASTKCTSDGFVYEERSFNGIIRGYCVFAGYNCTKSPSCYENSVCLSSLELFSDSECLAVDYVSGNCKPCDYPVTDCSSFADRQFCSQEYSPVCAKVRIGPAPPYSFEDREWGNACSACFNSKDEALVISYRNGTC